jgi:hypothetical protein
VKCVLIGKQKIIFFFFKFMENHRKVACSKDVYCSGLLECFSPTFKKGNEI